MKETCIKKWTSDSGKDAFSILRRRPTKFNKSKIKSVFINVGSEIVGSVAKIWFQVHILIEWEVIHHNFTNENIICNLKRRDSTNVQSKFSTGWLEK